MVTARITDGRWPNVILPALGAFLVLALWEIAVRVGLVTDIVAASPTEIFQYLANEIMQGGPLVGDLLSTLQSFVIGVGLAAVIAVPVGFASAWFRSVEYAISPFVWVFYNTPKIAFYPLFIIAVGLGKPTIVLICFLFALFPLYDAGFTAVRQANDLTVMAARAFGASDLTLMRKVILPSSVPVLAAGLRLGMGHGLVGVIVGELFGSDSGLGFRMNEAASTLDVTTYFGCLFVVMAIGVASSEGLRFVEHRTSRWRPN